MSETIKEIEQQLRRDFPTLEPKHAYKLKRAGIQSCNELVEVIKTFGLRMLGKNGYYFDGPESPTIRMAGAETWTKFLAMLDHVGFDWKPYLIPQPSGLKTKAELRNEIDWRINELIRLLEEYQRGRQIDTTND